MKMKKKLFLLISLLAMGLSSCVMYNGQGKPGASKEKAASSAEPVNYSIEPATPPAPHGAGESEQQVPADTTVKVYLVFGENGLYKGNPVTEKNTALFLEHVKEFSGKVGEDLPGKNDVTSSVSGSTFVAWTAYNNDGKLTEYTKFPSVDNKILYASFTGGQGGAHSGGSGSGGSGSGGETPQPQPSEYPGSTKGSYPTTGYGLLFSDGTYMAAVYTDSFEGFNQYLISKRSFRQGQQFSLCDFGNNNATWIKPINTYSFDGKTSEYVSSDEANQKYVALQDFNIEGIYIKLKMIDNVSYDEVYFELAH